jgi:hypothetical protein
MQTIRESRYPICTDAILEKGNPLGLEEAAHAEPVRRIVESDTDDAPVDGTVPIRSVNPNCLPKPFDPDAACDKDDFISEDHGQVASGSASLPDPVALETEEQRLQREQNERDVLEALGEYKCDPGMSVENVHAIVTIRTVKGRFIAHKFSIGWAVDVAGLKN